MAPRSNSLLAPATAARLGRAISWAGALEPAPSAALMGLPGAPIDSTVFGATSIPATPYGTAPLGQYGRTSVGSRKRQPQEVLADALVRGGRAIGLGGGSAYPAHEYQQMKDAAGWIPNPLQYGYDAAAIGTNLKQQDDPALRATPLDVGLAAVGVIPGVGPEAAGLKQTAKGFRGAQKAAAAAATERALRGIINTPDLRQMTTAGAIEAARREPHLMQDTTGQFIGAPRGLMSRDQLQIMRNRFDAQVEAGISGGDWYERAREANRRWAGDDPARQRLIAQEEALWSAQATPDTNMNFMLQGHNAWEMGTPLDKVRTGQQARTYNKARASGEDIGLGDKTGIYGMHLDPTKPFATTGTNDIWHARAFGYTNPGGEEFSRALTAQEHRFLDYETLLAVDRANAKRLGGRSDWGAHEIQAAPWVAGKGRGLAKKSRGKKTEAQGIAEASMTYPDLVGKFTADPVYQQVPGTSWSAGNQPGRDRLYDAVGFYQEPTVSGASGMRAQPLVGLQGGGLGVDPASRAGMNLVEGIRSYTDMTPQGEWSKLIFNAPAGEQNALHVPMGREATPEQLMQLGAIGAPHGLGHVTGTGTGVTMAGYGPGGANAQRLGKLLKERALPARIEAVTGAVPRRGAIERNVIPMHDPRFVEGSGQATDRVLRLWEGVPESVQGKLSEDAAIRSKAADNLRVMGQSLRPDQRNALRILAEGGMRALAAARRSGKIALPAATVALLGAGALPALPAGRRQQQAAGPQEY